MVRRVLPAAAAAAAAVGVAAVVASPARANYHKVGDLIPPTFGVLPGALAIDQHHDDGPMAVLDGATDRIIELTTFRNSLGAFTTSGCSLPPNGEPYDDIAIDPGSGNVYFSDDYWSRVFVCTRAGAPVRQYRTHITPGTIAIISQSAAGKWLLVVAASDYDNTIETIDAGGNWHNWGPSGDGPGQLPNLPDGMTVDPSRRVVYVSVDNDVYDNERARIEKFTPSGSYLGEWSVKNAAGNGTPPPD